MVVTYLKKLQEEYAGNKLALEDEINKLQILIRENSEFEKLLEESNDSNYELFTPREVNVKNKKKLQEIQDEQKELEEKLKNTLGEYNEFLKKLEEITVVIDSAVSEKNNQNKEGDKNISGSIDDKAKDEQTHLYDSVLQSLNHILHKIELCSKILDIDTVRSKIELKTTSKQLQSIIDEMEQDKMSREGSDNLWR